jgi:hypothetical protein
MTVSDLNRQLDVLHAWTTAKWSFVKVGRLRRLVRTVDGETVDISPVNTTGPLFDWISAYTLGITHTKMARNRDPSIEIARENENYYAVQLRDGSGLSPGCIKKFAGVWAYDQANRGVYLTAGQLLKIAAFVEELNKRK